MKIAILGTRGIPNKYGGFEQCAEKLSKQWVEEGHKVVVYNVDEHEYKESEWNGVEIRHIFAKESKFGIWGTFAYDYLCLKDAVKDDFDIILNLGYVPSALFFRLKKKTKAKFITNVDGMEWQRAKWNSLLKKFIKFCERLTVKHSDALICDNPGIKDYFLNKYSVEGFCIPYGAEIFNSPDLTVLDEYNVAKEKYFMLIARLEPENNIEMILEGYVLSEAEEPFLVVGNYKTKYGQYLKNKFEHKGNIKFLGAIYNYDKLSTLRMFAKLYFHGHSVGGTNPSLLEAMASKAYIAAHNNEFNRYVLEDNAFYFENEFEVRDIIRKFSEKSRNLVTEKNLQKIVDYYNWNLIVRKYMDCFEKTLEK